MKLGTGIIASFRNHLKPKPDLPAEQTPEQTKRLIARRRELTAMKQRFSWLPAQEFGEDTDPESIAALYTSLIPVHHPPALPAQERNALWSLASRGGPSAAQANRLIAESDIRAGIVHSTHVRKHVDLWESVKDQLLAHEAAYGAPVFSVNWQSYSRGTTLAYYFSSIERDLQGKRVLHIAPEAELSAWFDQRSRALSCRYDTLNLGGDVTFVEDMTKLPMRDATYDWVIAHRVLEHVFDEDAAISEVFRVLKPKGVFNVSVPESMQMDTTDFWAIPDLTHHYHYRQYGSDFHQTLSRNGFEVSVVDWLLNRSHDRLNEAGAYPLRAYNARRP